MTETFTASPSTPRTFGSRLAKLAELFAPVSTLADGTQVVTLTTLFYSDVIVLEPAASATTSEYRQPRPVAERYPHYLRRKLASGIRKFVLLLILLVGMSDGFMASSRLLVSFDHRLCAAAKYQNCTTGHHVVIGIALFCGALAALGAYGLIMFVASFFADRVASFWDPTKGTSYVRVHTFVYTDRACHFAWLVAGVVTFVTLCLMNLVS